MIKTITTLLITLFSITLSYAQEENLEKEVFDYPDLKNPKIIEIQRILEVKDIDHEKLTARYDAIFNGNNIEDKVHLFVFDLTHPRGPFADFMMKYNKQAESIFTAIDALPDSDFKKFTEAVTYKTLADRIYQQSEKRMKYLDYSFHTFLHLASRGDDRSIIPLTKVSSELYVLGFEDEHFSEELVLDLYSNYFKILSNRDALFNYLRKGLYYVNTYGVPLTDEEKKENQNYKDISSKIIKRYLVENPKSDQDIIYGLWKSHLFTNSFTGYEINYNPEIGKNITVLVESFKNDPAINYKRIKSVDFLFQYFLDDKSGLNIQDYIKLFNSKKEAYDFLIGYFDKVSEFNDVMELLNRQPKWVATFQTEIEQDINRIFPYVVRFSDEAELVLANKKLEISAVKKSVENFDFINTLLYKKDLDGGYLLYNLYRYSQLMPKVMKQNNFNSNSELKWETARMLLDFEISYLSNKTIHSPTILAISSTFNNWTATEIKKYKKDVEAKLLTYLEMYEEISDFTMEGDIVKGELEKIAIKFDLL